MSDPLHGLCLFHPEGHLGRPANPFGKDIANAALFRGLLNHGLFTHAAVLNRRGLSPEQLFEAIDPVGDVQLFSAPLTDTNLPARYGTLLRGQPYLSELSWLRRGADLDLRYSLVGLIHTIAPPAVRELISASAVSATHPWDALVCTSPAVQEAMSILFDGLASHLKARLGADKVPRPQLPLIPLAVDAERLMQRGADLDARLAFRRRLGLTDEDVLVLWVGRLSYYEKAFPQSMFQAMSLASKQSDKRLHFLLVGWFPGGEVEMKLYQQAADLLAPDLNVVVMDGNDTKSVDHSWAAADVFFSLVDNIQETFGLTPVEAMSAGLPVVVSDWDGYRYTVRDGVDGFLIPTLASPGGLPGELLAGLHSLEVESYQAYVGATAQHTAVHVPKAAEALVRLANHPEQRRAMGAAGQQRALSTFSWPQVAGLYRDLFEELAERRQVADTADSAAGARVNPNRGEPFADFRHFATDVLEPSLRLRLADGAGVDDLDARLAVHLNGLYSGLRVTRQETIQVLKLIEAAGPVGLTVKALLAEVPSQRRPFMETTLVWLAKMGLVDWLPRP